MAKKKPKRLRGRRKPAQNDPVSPELAGKMFELWAEHRNMCEVGRAFKVSESVIRRIKKRDDWDMRFEKKVVPQVRAVFEKRAVKKIVSNLEIVQNLKNKVLERLLKTFEPDSEEKLPLPTIDQFCRLILTEESILNGPQPSTTVNINEFGGSLTLVQINAAMSPEERRGRYLELADRIRETAEIETTRDRIDPSGDSTRSL